MWPVFVVLVSPVGYDSPCFEEILEPADTQAFLAQFAVETFDIAVLRRFARLRVDEVDLAFQIPREEVSTR